MTLKTHSKLKNHEDELRLNDCAATLPLEMALAVLNLTLRFVGRASCISNAITSIMLKMFFASSAETREAAFTHKRQSGDEHSKLLSTPMTSLQLLFPQRLVACFIQLVPGRAGGGSFKRQKNYKAKKELAYRMCARRRTSAMPKPSFLCEGAFSRSLVVMSCALM